MNKQESDVLIALCVEPFINHRNLSAISDYSPCVIKESIKKLTKEGYLDTKVRLTPKAMGVFSTCSPKNAIILAAGFCARMVPINTQVPKALIEVNGEPLIERLIRQLHEVGIMEIYVVVGFRKEQFEYLADKYGVSLIINDEYALKNNLHSLALALPYIANTYIIPCDIWCDKNPFRQFELYSWYMVSDQMNKESTVRVNKKMELVAVSKKQSGNTMVGISYLTGDHCEIIRERLKVLDGNLKYNDSFWEDALMDGDKMIVYARLIHANNVVEINTYEQLRDLDAESCHLESDAISIIAKTLEVSSTEIMDITVLKKGMTNHSFLFTCKNKKYIMRIPGEGTDQLINRRDEAQVYQVIKDREICDDIVYINPENGYKITRFLENSRVCNANNFTDLQACMKKLREFHSLDLKVDHEFDIFGQIDFYESLWDGAPSIYSDYKTTKEHVLELKEYIDKHVERKCLTHIDAVPDNFLFTEDGSIRLIDWEYAGMQDPHVDIAMFCIYALYNKFQVDRLINLYFVEGCSDQIRIKIYCYIAVCGLLWSNWCEYKRNLGVEFGEYSVHQYQYAKDFYDIVQHELSKLDNNQHLLSSQCLNNSDEMERR